ncbi:hypothetical protein E4U55_001068, partial [Claviceps digitariae]
MKDLAQCDSRSPRVRVKLRRNEVEKKTSICPIVIRPQIVDAASASLQVIRVYKNTWSLRKTFDVDVVEKKSEVF